MKPRSALLLCVMSTCTLCAESDWSFSGSSHVESESFFDKQEGKNNQSTTLKQKLELKYGNGNFSFQSNLYAQGDVDDTRETSKQTKRSFGRVDEFYGSYEFAENIQSVSLGKRVFHWGALEVNNITDVFNPLDTRNSFSSEDKLGVWASQYRYFTDNGTFSFLVKHYEQDQKISAEPYAYYLFPTTYDLNAFVTVPVSVDTSLQTSNGRSYPTSYISYTASTEWDNALDYALILQHGYDSQKAYSFSGSLSGAIISTQSYLVNKFLTYNTMVLGSTLAKLEFTYTDVIDDSLNISDYLQLGLGVEHEFSDLFKGDSKLSFLSEYYLYETFDKNKLSDLELYQVFQNDLFLGFRYALNDADDTSVLAGAIIDLEYDEQAYTISFETRLKYGFKMNVDYQYIEPSKTTNTAYASIGKIQSVKFDMSYHF